VAAEAPDIANCSPWRLGLPNKREAVDVGGKTKVPAEVFSAVLGLTNWF